MKTVITFAFLFFVSSFVHAQTSPSVISYQGLISSNGKPADSGVYAITVALYSDSAGSACVWRDTYWTPVTNGVFNLSLGSHVPLPGAEAMDRPMWLGVSVNGSVELRPLSQLSSSPYAINVADSSITAQKMATDYVSGISIDGTKITNRGGALNLSSEGIVKFQFDSSSNSVFANLPIASVPNSSVYWSESGNNSTTPGLNYVGTSDSVALEIHVNDGGDTTAGNGRVMRYEPMPTSPNIIGGYHGNVVSTTNGGSVIAGGGSSIYPNSINGDFSVVGGGAGNTAINGGSVAGGAQNTAGIEAFIGGGAQDSAGYLAVVSGGLTNTARSEGSVVSGGTLNKAFGADATVSGGATNTASGPYDAIGGGTQNIAYDSGSVVAGGVNNSAQFEGAVGGGLDNQADTLSAIPGGAGLSLGKYSFGFNAGSSATTIGDSNVAYFGNVDLEIASPDGVPRQLRIFSTYGPYTSFQAASSGSGMDIHYTLPGFQGLTNTVLTNDGTGQLAWNTLPPDTSEWLLKGNHGTAPPTNFLGTTDSNSLELHVFDSGSSTYGAKRVMRYEVNDTSANILGGYHDNAIIPLDTSLHSHIVGVVIAGGGSNGHPNSVIGSYAVVSGGQDNQATRFAFVGGGDSNKALGIYSAIVGGDSNNIEAPPTGSNCFIGAGSHNLIDSWGSDSGDYSLSSAIVAGVGNEMHEAMGFIGAGRNNKVMDDMCFIGAGEQNTVSIWESGIVAGFQNTIVGYGANYGFIGAGSDNRLDTSGYSFIGDGNLNLIHRADMSAITGGGGNIIIDSSFAPQATFSAESFNFFSAIGGGDNNIIYGNGKKANIPGGEQLRAQSYAQTVIGFNNKPQGSATDSTSATTTNTNDRVLIIGNGSGSDSAHRSNAFEVMNKGTSIVYCTNGTGGATMPPGPIGNGAIYGGRYQDNTCYGWGDAKGIDTSHGAGRGTCHVNSDFGVDSIVYESKGQYRVFLNTVDPYLGTHVNFSTGFSVTATVVVILPGIPFDFITVTPLGYTGGVPGNAFDIFLGNTAGFVDGEVMFHVFGRQ